jgi:hypothetical protein
MQVVPRRLGTGFPHPQCNGHFAMGGETRPLIVGQLDSKLLINHGGFGAGYFHNQSAGLNQHKRSCYRNGKFKIRDI